MESKEKQLPNLPDTLSTHALKRKSYSVQKQVHSNDSMGSDAQSCFIPWVSVVRKILKYLFCVHIVNNYMLRIVCQRRRCVWFF